MAHVILFEHRNFEGNHKHVFARDANLTLGDSFMDDKTSSFVILEGRWEFFSDPNFIAKFGPTVGPGQFPSITDALGGGSNDRVSSLRPV